MSLRLVDSLATTEPLAAVFSDTALIRAMLRFEVALARAEASAGVIPQGVAETIARLAVPEGFDSTAIAVNARTSATIVVPFVDALIARVASIDPAAATFVHWGATSQDVADSALALCIVDARSILQTDHERLTSALRTLSDRHVETIMLGRTLLQPAPPVTFGLKAAGWFGAVSRAGASLFHALTHAAVLQFGGAAGTLAALGDRGLEVASALARDLNLALPPAPWHAQRDRFASLVATSGVYCGTLGKIARDVTLLMQEEVAEASEPGGGSSTMPHKRNPANCAIALGAAARMPGLVASCLAAMPHEHERGVGGWPAEMTTIASAIQTTGAALAAMSDAVGSLRVDVDRMRANLANTGGAVFAERAITVLAPSIGRESARKLIASALDTARKRATPFADALATAASDSGIRLPDDLSNLASPEAYLGVADTLRRRLLGENE